MGRSSRRCNLELPCAPVKPPLMFLQQPPTLPYLNLNLNLAFNHLILALTRRPSIDITVMYFRSAVSLLCI